MNHLVYLCFISTLVIQGCKKEKEESLSEANDTVSFVNPDRNQDGDVNILVLGSNVSIKGGEAFSPNQIADELQKILQSDTSLTGNVNVISEDIHLSQSVTIGLGGNGDEYTYTHHSHSLVQYYYWPEGFDERMEELKGNGDFLWDHVVIGADPYILSTTPGFYALGVNKVAGKVLEGEAQPHLLLVWPQNEMSSTSMKHFEEFTYRTADAAKEPLPTIPAGMAWASLSDEQKDNASVHPTPNGAYLSAATIYSHITGQSASTVEYTYDDVLAEVAFSMVKEVDDSEHYTGSRTFISPFNSCDVSDDVLTYNHTGSSSENGILGGLNWVFEQAEEHLENGTDTPMTFNYGRANSNFEPNKRYQINPALFEFSFGFPMQDHGNRGDVSMLYGIDKRDSGVDNDTDLGVANFMIDQDEIPYARAIPIRTLFAQMKEINPNQSAYRDSWHMHRDLDKAIGAYMYTVLTGKCALGDEPTDLHSDDWNTWMAHNIGCDTALILTGMAD